MIEGVLGARIERRPWREIRTFAGWARGTKGGFLTVAALVGLVAGFGAVGFRVLIFAVTWLFTGHQQYGLQGWITDPHLSRLGPFFVVLVPALGGLLFGPLIFYGAREAKGHGVPEVMLAVAENGGRIRPRVSLVKAAASALCIGSGGSVGREGPIVQIGSSLASTAGQALRMSEARLRILVACGAAGGISATFNAPLTGVFFGLELILAGVSAEALAAVLTASMAADTVSRAFFGSSPFFSGLTQISLANAHDYLLAAVLGVLAGLVGAFFKSTLYRVEDLADGLWGTRPDWLRPVAGGLVLGLLLLALPELYGVGYPVMLHALSGGYVFWFLLLLVAGKILATSLTMGIGGSGGVFAPSLFIGACLGYAFGALAHIVFGVGAGTAAAYGMIAMGAVFSSAARAPLTATASVVEMTGAFGVLLPLMLATAAAAVMGAWISRGTIYTTKLLRRGIDISAPRAANLVERLTVADAMTPLASPLDLGEEPPATAYTRPEQPDLQTVLEGEGLDQALRQLVLFGHDGLPVLDQDRSQVVGWVSSREAIRTLAQRLGVGLEASRRGAGAAEHGRDEPRPVLRPYLPLRGYRLVEIRLTRRWPVGAGLAALHLPKAAAVVGVRRRNRSVDLVPEAVLAPGDLVSVLTRVELVGEIAERYPAQGSASAGQAPGIMVQAETARAAAEPGEPSAAPRDASAGPVGVDGDGFGPGDGVLADPDRGLGEADRGAGDG